MALSRDSNLVEAPVDKQFQELLWPLDSVKQYLVGSFVVVMIAFDECYDDSRNMIANSFTILPAAFKFLVTSRLVQIPTLRGNKTAVQELSPDIATQSHNDVYS